MSENRVEYSPTPGIRIDAASRILTLDGQQYTVHSRPGLKPGFDCPHTGPHVCAVCAAFDEGETRRLDEFLIMGRHP